jgi:hypothetical protein
VSAKAGGIGQGRGFADSAAGGQCGQVTDGGALAPLLPGGVGPFPEPVLGEPVGL